MKCRLSLVQSIVATFTSIAAIFLLSVNGVAQSNHTVTFSGSSADFNAAEKLSAAASNTDYYVTFDANNLYLGAFRTSGTFGATDNFTVYLDTDPNATPTSGSGTLSGQTYNGVSGTLPFSANYNIHAEQGFQEARSESGSWASTISGLTYHTGSTWREVTIPFSSIGNPDALYLTMWMGYANGIYSNAPGADLGNGANPTVINFIGGFGVSSADCIPVNTQNSAITASITDAVPASGMTYGKIIVTSASVVATNDFNVAAGGSLQMSGGSLDISGRTILMGNSSTNGTGTTIALNGGSLLSSNSTNLQFEGAGSITGSALSFDGKLMIKNKFIPQASGATTLSATAVLDIRAGGFISTNSFDYDNGSTLMYNTGTVYTASNEWVPGITTGTGLPANVVIGNNVANSGLSFGTSAAFRHMAGNLTVSNATSGSSLTLSTVSGGDLSIDGNFTQNGTFTHSSRLVTFSGSGAQSITGSLNTTGASNNFRFLAINNYGTGVTINSDVLISSNSSDALRLINSGSFIIGNGRTLTIEGSGGAVLVSGGSRNIHFASSTSVLNFTGTKTVSAASGGTLNFTSASVGGCVKLSAGINFGNLLSTIGNNVYLEILAGGSVVTNPPTYASGSTLIYNNGSTFTAGAEWSTNTTTGSGVPSNVLIGNGNNTALTFGTSNLFRHANDEVSISSGSSLTLSSIAGGDLQLRGDFEQNGTFTSNGRAVTFNGTSAQSITGALNTAGASNNFNYLIINNTHPSGVTINTNILVSQTTGDVLQLLNSGPLNVAATRALTLAGNGGNIRVTGGSRTINFNAASSTMNITGTKTVAQTTGGSLNFSSSAANGVLKISAAVNFGASLTTIGNNTYFQLETGGSVNTNPPIYAAGSSLAYNTGAFNASTEWTPNSTSASGVPSNVLIGNGTNTPLSFAASAQFRHANGNITISPSSSLTLSSAAGGNLQLRGDFNNTGTFTHNNRDVTFNGTSGQQLSGATTFQNLILNNSAGLTLNNSITVASVLTLTSGSITLGANNITLSSTATGAIAGTFSSSRMIITNGTGQLIRAIATGTNYTFPVGETTGTTEYSPALFNFSASGVARNIGVRVIDADHPQLNSSPTQTDYISRYWSLSNSAASTYTYTSSFTFANADLNGAEANLRANMWNGSAWTQTLTSSSASNVLSITSGATNATLPLGATAEFAGRVSTGTQYVWNQTGTTSFATATNWTPNRTTPAANDILVFSNGGSPTASNVPTQTIGQLLISNNTNISFTSSASNTLTIAGSNGIDMNIASGSTLQISTTGVNSLDIAFANSTATTIAGTLTLNANNAFDNTFNCTNGNAVVTGSINSLGVVTSSGSNLSFSSGANYRHNFTSTAGSIPVANWDTNSTCTVQGYTINANQTGNLGQSFGNFVWNCSAQANAISFNGALTTVNGNLTISSTGSSRIHFVENATATLNVAGNMTISGANTSVRLASANGTYTAQLIVAGNYTQNSASSSFNLNNGNAGTTSVFKVGGNFSFSAGTISQPSGSTAGNLMEFNGSALQTITISGTLPAAGEQTDYRFNNVSGFNLTGTIPVRTSSTLYRSAGAITGGTISYNATGTTLEYEGTTAMTTGVEFPGTNGPENVTINSTNIISLSATRSLPNTGVFTNTSGILSLGSFDLNLLNTGAGAIVNTSPSASNMIAADGTGQLKLTLPNTGRVLNFFIGDVTGTTEYSGMRLNFTANSLSNRTVGVRVVDANNASLNLPYPPIDYTSRYWVVTLSSSTGTFTYTPTLFYDDAGDVNGTENNLQVAAFPTAATAWNHYATTISGQSLATNSSLNQASFALNGAHFTGRTPVKYWNGSVSSNWNTANNWTPSGIPVSTDNIDINTSTPNICTLASGSVTINHLTLNQTGTLNVSSGATLTVAGNLTYVNTAITNFDCGSTFNLTNTTFNQTIPALQYGNLGLGSGARTLMNADTIRICGNYTPTTGAITTAGSTVEFNGISTQSISTNSTSFNNLLISNVAANVNCGVNTSVGGNIEIVQNARYNQTANTLTLSGTGQVSGYLRNGSNINSTGSLVFNSTGIYEHNITGGPGTIPNATWSTGSTCELIGNFNSGNINCQSQNFHHFKVNFTGNGDIDANGTLQTINGDFTCSNTGTGSFTFANNDVDVDIAGDFIQSGGDLTLASTNNTNILVTLLGNFTQSGGSFDFYSGGGGSSAEIQLLGNYARTGNGSITTSGFGPNNGLFTFSGTNQTITETTSGSNNWIDYYISSGSNTKLLSNLQLAGSLFFTSTITASSGSILDFDTYNVSGSTFSRVNIASGSKARTANTAGWNTSGATGSVRTTTRTYSSGATYEYYGNSNQNTGTFLTSTSTANTITNLIIDNNASSVTLNSGAGFTITGSLTFTSSNTSNLDVGSQTVYLNSTSTGAISRLGSGHVIGNLRRGFASGTNTYVYHIGTSTAYSPATLSLNASAVGSLTAKATDGAHPNMATDGLSQTSYVNRYWTLTPNTGNITSGSAAFAYVSVDLIGGATESSLKLKRYNAGWTSPSFTSATNLLTALALNNTTTQGDFFAASDCSGFATTITADAATIFCNGGSVNLTASSNITGSTYAWSPSTGLSSTTGATVNASPTSTQTYTVTATSPQNCSDTETITVTVNPRPTGAISGTTTICDGSSANLSIAVTGNGPWSGTLSNGASFSGSASPIVVSVSPSSSLTYTISTLSDANCTAQAADKTGSAAVTVNPRPTGAISGTATICNGSSTNLSIALTGTGPWSGALSDGTTFSGSASPIVVSVSPSSSLTYTIATLSDANCTAQSGDKTGSAVVTVNERPTGVIGGSQSICTGGSAPIYINVTGSGTISGTLNPGAISFSGTAPTIFLNVSPTGNTTYTIATLNDSNCSATLIDLSGSAAIVVNPAPSVSISGTTTVCSGSSTTVSFSGSAFAQVTYSINGGSNQTITLDGSGNASLNTGTIFSNQTYSLVSVNNGTCTVSASGSAVITKHDLPESDMWATPITVCGGSSSIIAFEGTPNATVTYTVNGGPNQTIVLDALGEASFTTGALFSTTNFTLVSITDGTCSQAIGLTSTVTVTGTNYYQDADADGFGNPSVMITACTAPVGYVANSNDCCDANAELNPNTEWWVDQDGDGYGAFVYDLGCLSGVTCNSATWPAQTIPYAASSHGNVPYASDCNDGSTTVHPGATEICNNNIDEDCDGIINDGCSTIANDQWTNATSVNVTNPNAIYPNCLIYNGVVQNATISTQGNIANVAVGGGKDVWYKFTAPSTAVQIKVVPNNFDAVIELQNSSATQLDVENVNTVIGGAEILNYSALTVGQTYWVGIRNYHPTNVGTFTVCVAPLMASGCAYVTPAGGFPLCNNYKAIYRGATSYTFNFTGTGGAAAFPYATTSATTNGLVALSTPSLDLRYGGIYQTRVDANYQVFNGLGVAEPMITVLGSVSGANCTGVSMIAQPDIEVKSTLRCPTTLVRSQFLIGTQVAGQAFSCGATSYTYEFTQVTDCLGATSIGMPFEVTTTTSTPYLSLTQAFPTPSFPMANLGHWKVRIRPNFSYGNGTYGPSQVIKVNGTSASAMLNDSEMIASEKSEEETITTGIYPNPNNGEFLNIHLTHLTEGNVYVRVMDAVGKCVYQQTLYTEGTLHTSITFDEVLTSGIYFIEFTNNGIVTKDKLLIEK